MGWVIRVVEGTGDVRCQTTAEEFDTEYAAIDGPTIDAASVALGVCPKLQGLQPRQPEGDLLNLGILEPELAVLTPARAHVYRRRTTATGRQCGLPQDLSQPRCAARCGTDGPRHATPSAPI